MCLCLPSPYYLRRCAPLPLFAGRAVPALDTNTIAALKELSWFYGLSLAGAGRGLK